MVRYQVIDSPSLLDRFDLGPQIQRSPHSTAPRFIVAYLIAIAYHSVFPNSEWQSRMAHVLRPLDVPVALSLAIRPNATFADLARDLGVSTSTAHGAVERLTFSGLMSPMAGRRHAVNLPALEEFLYHGIRYAFPARRGRRQRGVPTSHSAPALQQELGSAADPVVWASSRGSLVGASLEPLIPGAPALPDRYPELYELLTLVDGLRIGTVRDREASARLLAARLDLAVA